MAVIEGLVEPVYVVAMLESNFTCRSRAEAAGLVAKSLTQAAGLAMVKFRPEVFFGKPACAAEEDPTFLTVFAISQLGFSLSWASAVILFSRGPDTATTDGSIAVKSYFGSFCSRLPPPSNLPVDDDASESSDEHQSLTSRYICSEHRKIIPEFLRLSLIKAFLSEGERVTMISVLSAQQYGTYGVVAHLAGVVCRLFFAPIEDAATIAFSKSDLCRDAHTGFKVEYPKGCDSYNVQARGRGTLGKSQAARGNTNVSLSKGKPKTKATLEPHQRDRLTYCDDFFFSKPLLGRLRRVSVRQRAVLR